MAATLEFYGWPDGTWGRFVLVMAWLYIFGYNTYGAGCTATFAPSTSTPRTTPARPSSPFGGINVVCALLLPVAIVGTIGQDALASDTTGVVYLTDVWHAIVGDTAGKILIALLCAGLLLMMNAGIMASSRVLHAMAKEGMTLRWFGRLNRNAVPPRAMTLGLVLNAWLLFQFPTVFFILAVGNLGFLLAHVLALSGFLLLRRDRPRWPRPIRLGPFWLVVAACVPGQPRLHRLRADRAAHDRLRLRRLGNPTAWMGRIVIVGVVALVLGCAGYVVGQHQQGKRFSLRDPSDQQPTAEAIDEVARGSPTRSTMSSTSTPPPA